MHNGSNNGKLAFSVRTGERLGMSKATAARGLHQIVAAGFVTAETPSSFNRKDRRAAEYGLAWLPIDGRTPTLGYRDIPYPEVNHSLTTRTDSLTTRTAERQKSA